MNGTNSLVDNKQGSVWHRWDPHIHTPGTVLNDQYTGSDPWDDFLSRIENSTPVIRVIGITDYYSIACYEKALTYKNAGRLANVELIFPNIELRFNTGTARDAAINGHLLVSPDDANHVTEINRFLQNLEYSVGTDTFRCHRADLIRLGYFHDKTIEDEKKALQVGTNQFKVTFDELQKAFKRSTWAQENILLAISCNTGDGTSGLNKDASFSSTRQYFERSSKIIFGGSAKQRLFWIGEGPMLIDELIEKYDGPKPCIHGSDAHTNDKVGKPDYNRFTWIKGDLTFDSLRQICIEPKDRVIVGEAPVNNQISSNIIDRVSITNANWINPPTIQLNSGLVTIIGARGSGKTALADLIAVGGTAISNQLNKTSFIKRAGDFLSEVEVKLGWQTGNETIGRIKEIEFEDLFDLPKVQYLSQQFVDQLCSAEGMTDELMNEIERVIFTAHPLDSRLSVSNFQELLALKASLPRTERENQQQIIDQCAIDITTERAKELNLPALRNKKQEKEGLIVINVKSKQALVSKGNDEKVNQFQRVSSARDKVSIKLEQAQRKRQSLLELQQATVSARASNFVTFHNKLVEKYNDAGLTKEQWNDFKVDFTGDVTKILTHELDTITKDVNTIKGISPRKETDPFTPQSFIPINTSLETLSYELLSQEIKRLQHYIGIDNENGRQFNRLSEIIVREEAELEKLNREISDAEGAKARIKALQEKRKIAYKEIFAALIAEEKELKDLYQPLMLNLKSQKGSLSKLSFHVQRNVNTVEWATKGEELLDLRKNGAFKGKGALLNAANTELKKVWETGSAEEVAEAIVNFREKHEQTILDHSIYERSDQANYFTWANNIGNWLYSTNHISIIYSVQYDGVNIQQLSPGTRGIVLLLLYLAIDKEDDRPLIIDQPEENLDPKSIFDELVPLFREVKCRRQIIIVTHNANLVVNTDADQVIVASCGPHKVGALPNISYESGGLENPTIRRHVCGILEGGEEAFKERAKRLRVII